MTTCRDGCGACCQPVTLPFSQREYQLMPPAELDQRTRDWVNHDLTPITRRQGLALAPWLKGKGFRYWIDEAGRPQAAPMSFFLCRHFDAETRRCGDYDGRPDACRTFPLNGLEKPKPTQILPPMCSFRVDQGLEVAPLPEWQPVELRLKETT